MNLTFTLTPDGAPAHIVPRVEARLAGLAASMPEGAASGYEIIIRPKTRTAAQNALMWSAVLPAVSAAYAKAGRIVPPEALHLDYKGRILPAACARATEETGAPEDFYTLHTLPSGRMVHTLTTTRLSVLACTIYLNSIAEEAAEMFGIDVFAGPPPNTPGGVKLRSGRVHEPSELESVPYDESDFGVYTVSDVDYTAEPGTDCDLPEITLELDATADGLEGQFAALFDTTGPR